MTTGLWNSILNLSVSNGLTGRLAGLYVPFIYTLFLFILTSNLVGLVPYSFTVTSQFALTIGLSMTIFIGVTILGLTEHGLGFFSLFVPSGSPLFLVPLLAVIETVSYLARSLSLGIRLAGNMFAGHVLLKIISGFIWKIAIGSALGVLLIVLPMVILFALLGLELAVAGIQAYVLTLLTCSYLRDAIYLH
jgi:F-type H+-transporting ATPase subunit a